MSKKSDKERDEAIAQLREWIKPGDTVYTILDRVSASGMSRAIRVVVPYVVPEERRIVATHTAETCPGKPCGTGCDHVEYRTEPSRIDHLHPNWAIGKAIGLRHWKRNGREQDALVVGGCGMDMGFHLVYQLSHVLYGQGYACLGKGQCPSNYHVNHRDSIRCEGTRVHNPDGPDFGSFCWRPSGWRGEELPADWPRSTPIDIGDGQTIPGHALTVVSEDGEPYIICPTCQGEGSLPNPEGPERFDLIHTDGYALNHRWL